jgi:copper chaperone CopZ
MLGLLCQLHAGWRLRHAGRTPVNATIVVVLALVALVAWAVWKSVGRARKGGDCCGEHEQTVARIGAKDADRRHYVYETQLEIGGMTCDNCARKVENALNALDGTWATVSISNHVARVKTKEPADGKALRAAVRQAGYVVLREL